MATIQLPKAPVATDWVTAVNYSGSGTAASASADINIDFSALPYFAKAVIQIEFTNQVTNATGLCYSQVMLPSLSLAEKGADATDPSAIYSTPKMASSTPITNIVNITPIVFSGLANVSGNIIRARIRTKGSAAGTEWSVSGIRARLIYSPI